jgi:hypothetical protein
MRPFLPPSKRAALRRSSLYSVQLTSRYVLIGALAILASCLGGDGGMPAEPLTSNRVDASLISDGAHSNGTAGFFFLPPVVSQPGTTGSLDDDIAFLDPVVAICDVTDGPVIGCGAPGGASAIRTFTVESDPAITLSGDKYSVNWDTGEEGFAAGRTYRVYVFAGPGRRELGFADVLVSAKPGQVKNHDGQVIVLNDGRTLPIHFRIEQGVVPRETPARSLHVDGLSDPIEAGTAGTITVTALDANGNVATGYVGTILFTSDDTRALLPASYTFTAADAGTHTFPAAVILGTAGTVTVSASDQADNTITGSQTVSVTPAAVAELRFTVQPSNTVSGVEIAPAVVVTAFDAFGNQATNFVGFIRVGLAGVTLFGTSTVQAVAGVATFSDLIVVDVGTGYTLTAALPGNPPIGMSAPFDILAAPVP